MAGGWIEDTAGLTAQFMGSERWRDRLADDFNIVLARNHSNVGVLWLGYDVRMNRILSPVILINGIVQNSTKQRAVLMK